MNRLTKWFKRMKQEFKYNTDYRKELPKGAIIYFFKDRTCPKCGSKIVVLPPDRGWCEDKNCNHGVLFLIGKGTGEFEQYTDNTVNT